MPRSLQRKLRGAARAARSLNGYASEAEGARFLSGRNGGGVLLALKPVSILYKKENSDSDNQEGEYVADKKPVIEGDGARGFSSFQRIVMLARKRHKPIRKI